jgi:hypothetical protein
VTTGTAWPFLIARGRRRGYTVLAAPGFLVRDGEEGFLEEVVGPTTAPVATREVHSPRGRRLCLTWADHQVCGGDVGEVSDVGEPADPVDEHSRPLRLLHGYLCLDTPPAGVDPVDLSRSLAAALATYRRFLRDEDTFTIEESTPFPVAARAVAPPPPSRPARPTALLATAALVTLLALLAGLWFITGDEQPEEQVVRPDQSVRGTIENAGEQDTYRLETSRATAVTLRADRPATRVVQLHDLATGKPLRADRPGCWLVDANAGYRLTVTSAQGEYSFRLDSSKRCDVTPKKPPGSGR